MARRKIRHALVQLTVKKGDKLNFETVFRNQIVDIPDDQVEHLDEIGATVDPDVDLERPGVMSVLPDTATDSEITNWVIGASNEEIEDIVAERPVMAARILSAQASVKARFEEQDRHLGGRLQQIADDFEESERARVEEEILASMDDDDIAVLVELQNLSEEEIAGLSEMKNAADAEAMSDLIGGSDGPLSPEDADNIVAGNAKSVTDYISENPRSASVILDAENRRAQAQKEDARVTVVRAAEAAAGFVG